MTISLFPTVAEVQAEITAQYGVSEDLTSFINKASNRILLYCNIQKITDQLFYEWVDMSYELYKVSQLKAGSAQNIQSVQQGKVHVTYGSNGYTNEYDVLMGHASVLNKFRRPKY